MSLKPRLAFIFVFAILAAPLWAQDLDIQFKTSPSIDQLRPHTGPAGLSVLVTDADGKPVENGWAEIRLDAPKSGRFFSTDIPLVEGTRLTEMRLPLRHGKVEWQYDWPIRGEYRLAVEATSADGKKASKTFDIAVRESSTKWLTLGGFALGLFVLGFVAGKVFTITRNGLTVLLLAMMVSGTALASAVSQQAESSEHGAQATLTIEPAVVGKPSRIIWRLKTTVSATSDGAMLSLAIKQIEEGLTVFALEKIPVAGEFTMVFQFADGSEHSVTAVAELPSQAPIRTQQRVAVTAVEPPATAALAPLAFFLFAIALGLGVGRWSKLRAATR